MVYISYVVVFDVCDGIKHCRYTSARRIVRTRTRTRRRTDDDDLFCAHKHVPFKTCVCRLARARAFSVCDRRGDVACAFHCECLYIHTALIHSHMHTDKQTHTHGRTDPRSSTTSCARRARTHRSARRICCIRRFLVCHRASRLTEQDQFDHHH